MRCEEEEEAEWSLAFSKRPDVGCRLARANHGSLRPLPCTNGRLDVHPSYHRASYHDHALRKLRRHQIIDTPLLLRLALYYARAIALLHLCCLLVHCDTVPVSSRSPALQLPKHPLRPFDSILAPVIGKRPVPSASIGNRFIEERESFCPGVLLCTTRAWRRNREPLARPKACRFRRCVQLQDCVLHTLD